MEKINFANNSEPYLSAENLNQMQDNIENAMKDVKTESTTDTYSCDYINKIGKSLWRGNFISGSITINGLSEYKIIGVFTSDSVMCIGSKNYGCGGFLEYGSDKNIAFNAYRFNVNGDILTIDTNNKGVSNGTKQISAVEIFGII